MPYRRSHPREFASWKNMMQRCNNPNHPRYAEWGGRGIRVCKAWTEFLVFLSDMGSRPVGTSLDRIDNDADYTPDNCRWASASQQQTNTRRSVHVTINARTQCLKAWCRELKINYVTVCMRIKRGMTAMDALTAPIIQRKK